MLGVREAEGRGESLGRGLVIDFSRYMRRWFTVPNQPTSVRIQAGLVLAALNRELAPSGRQFGPDPATRSVTTMGSVLSINASGSHYLRSGSARDTVESVEWSDRPAKCCSFRNIASTSPPTKVAWH